MLNPNTGKDLERGNLLSKTRDIYCEVLSKREISELKLETVHEEDDITETNNIII